MKQLSSRCYGNNVRELKRYGFSAADIDQCRRDGFTLQEILDNVEYLLDEGLFKETEVRDQFFEEMYPLLLEGRGMDHPPFIRFNETTRKPYVVVPLLARYIREHVNYILVYDSGKQCPRLFVYKDGVYKLYNRQMMLGEIKAHVEAYNEELVRMRGISEAYNLLVSDLDHVEQDKLDADETLINFQNGLLRVTDKELSLIPHTPDVYSTIQIPCRWIGQQQPTPVFDQYLKTLTNGDNAVAQLLLEFIGICISNIKGWRMKKSLFLEGDGDTGKSLLKSLVELLLGRGNFIGIDLKEIEARFGTGAIYGTRLAGSSDMSFQTVNELATFKKLTGGDSVFAEFKGQDGFEFTYNGVLWFCTNRLPKFGGDAGQWVYDRLMIVRCPNIIPKDQQDKQLLDKLYAERDGIVYKAVMALQTVIANGYRFSEPSSVTEAREAYKADNNTVIEFYENCMCERSRDKNTDRCTATEIYDVYRNWCSENNYGQAKTAKVFRDTLAKHIGSTYKEITIHTDKGTCYKTLTLTPEAKMYYSQVYASDSVQGLTEIVSIPDIMDIA